MTQRDKDKIMVPIGFTVALIICFIILLVIGKAATQPTLTLADDKFAPRTFTLDPAGNYRFSNGVGGFVGAGNVKALRGECSVDVDTVIQPDAVSFYRLQVHGDACRGTGQVVVTRTVQGVTLAPIILTDTHIEEKGK